MPGELVHKPAVDGTEAEVAAFGPGAGLRDVCQEPGELGSRKIWIEHQPGDRPGPRFEPSALQRGAAICGSPVLPHDRTVDGLAAVSQPQSSCLPLVGDSDRGNGLRLDPGVAECSLDAMEGRAPDFVQVVLHPARLGEILSELAVRRAENAQLGIDHQDVRAGGALIDGQDVFLRPHLNPQATVSPRRSTDRHLAKEGGDLLSQYWKSAVSWNDVEAFGQLEQLHARRVCQTPRQLACAFG